MITGIPKRKHENYFKPLNAKLNPICHLLALLRAHPILHVSRIRDKWILEEWVLRMGR
jgi:hypothetical protein